MVFHQYLKYQMFHDNLENILIDIGHGGDLNDTTDRLIKLN